MTLLTESAEEFAAALPDGGVLLGLDPGTKSIGTALCDAGWRFATAAKTLDKGKFTRDAAVLAELAKERDVRGVVCGLPRNMDGSEGPRAQSVRGFASNLSGALGLPLLLWDERWSTVSAARDLIGQDWSRAKRSARIDAHAAAVILQAAIDRLAQVGG